MTGTTRRGFIGALLALPFLARFRPAAPIKHIGFEAAKPLWTIRFAPRAFDSTEPSRIESTRGCTVRYERGAMVIIPDKVSA